LTDLCYLELVPDGKGSERMLTVDHYELIRRKVEIAGETQRDVAKELGHSRKTVAKALKLRIPPGYRLGKPRPRPVLDPFRHIIGSTSDLRNSGRGICSRHVSVTWPRAMSRVMSRTAVSEARTRICPLRRMWMGSVNWPSSKGPDIHGGKSVGELLEEERPYLLALQSERFAACRRRSTFVDSHALIHMDTVRYSVPVEWAYHPCVIEAFVNQVRIWCSHEL